MIGPNQSSMARLTSGAHGEPVEATKRSDDRSYFARTSGGSLSRRTYMIGTR
ncbi:hypothetical protein D3C81_1891020 [compost metagenome]